MLQGWHDQVEAVTDAQLFVGASSNSGALYGLFLTVAVLQRFLF